MSQPDRTIAAAFLSALDPDASAFSFQIFDDWKQRAKKYKKYGGSDPYRTAILHGSLEKCWADLVAYSARGCGVFVTINQTDLKGRAAANVTRIRAAFVDLDQGGPLPAFHRPPHIVVESSAGKWHVYWRVRDCGLDQFEALQRRLLRHYGGDRKITDRSRVMRLPGFPHQKAEPSFLTHLVEVHDGEVYAVADLESELPAGEIASGDSADPSWDGLQAYSGTVPWTDALEMKLRSALGAIPTDEATLDATFGDSRLVWINVGRSIERLGWGARGYEIWRDWSRQNVTEFDEGGLRVQWRSFARTRDGAGKKVTIGTVCHYAREFGWHEPDEQRGEVEPTYADEATTAKEKARAELERLIEAFLDAEPNAWERYGEITRVVHAVQATTGVGKTKIAARVIARRIKSGQLTGPVGYAVPTHRLGEKLADQFREHGISVAQWRGRDQFISGDSGPKMCEDLAAVAIADNMGAVIETACCKGRNPAGKTVTCPFYNHCAYQKQKAHKPDVWLFAHAMLFHKTKTLAGLSALFIDEDFRDAGTTKPERGLTFEEIEATPAGPCSGELGFFRDQLAGAMRAQVNKGGVPRESLARVLQADWCTRAIQIEWMRKEKATIWPGMPAKARAEAAKTGVNTRHIRTFHRIWSTVRELLEREDDVVSGRLYLADVQTDHGRVRVVKTRGIRPITEQFEVPTFIMDATLPARSILATWFSDVQVVGQIEVPMSRQTTVKQVLGAPVAEKKLIAKKRDREDPADKSPTRNLKAVHRYVLQEWIKTGRGSAVIIMQKTPEAALRALGLPPEIATEHFNNIEGLDQYKDVRLLMVIGRTQPGPEPIEADAGALSGIEPATVLSTGRWYDKVTRGIRMADGRSVAVETDRHPDELTEAVRWQVCEGKLVQALGRARAVNRTDATPLDIAIVNDVVLPITVDVVEEWEAAGFEIYMVASGIWLESPSDMSKAWPDAWATEMAAKNWLRDHTVLFPYKNTDSIEKLHRVLYQHPGERQRWRTAWIDPAIIPDGRAWLESRLGIQLAGYQVTTIYFLKAEGFSVGGLDFATPADTVRPGPAQEMASAIDAAPPEYFAAFGITKQSWHDWRAGGKGTDAGGKLPWSAPVVEEVFPTPEELAALRALPSAVEGGEPVSRETTHPSQ
jgi:hypothetical protein